MRLLKLDDLSPSLIPDLPWLLVLGGNSPTGMRRALRIAMAEADRHPHILLVSSYPELDEALSQHAFQGTAGERLMVIDYSGVETSTWASRLYQGRSLKRNRITRPVWSHFLRRIGLAFRPYAGWIAIKARLETLHGARPPEQILYCDTYGLSIAWHIARMWPRVPVTAGLKLD